MKIDVKSLPSVGQVLAEESVTAVLRTHNREYVVAKVRGTIQRLRQGMLSEGAGSGDDSKERAVDRAELLDLVVTEVRKVVAEGEVPSLHRVINATGVILHTGLGRAPLPGVALAAVSEAAERYCNLELDLASGSRGSRLTHVESLICELSGSESAAVVNNNAAAVMLMLNTLARDREVVVSRGQLVEIGGSFRIPDIIAVSGARIREVGTTNRTHLRDYENAIGTQTALILAVHPSNYEVQGFTAEVELDELVALGKKANLPVAYDLGAGALLGLERWGLPHEPVVSDCLQTGVDVVTFSGDKILGGPQAGIAAGSRQWVEPMTQSPMMRALRCDKLILAALEATLRLFRLDAEALLGAHPVLRMMTESEDAVEGRANAILAALSTGTRERAGATVSPCQAQVGSGSLPLEELPSYALVCEPSSCSAEELARRLRAASPPVVGRINREQVILDMRTVRGDEMEGLIRALTGAVESISAERAGE